MTMAAYGSLWQLMAPAVLLRNITINQAQQ